MNPEETVPTEPITTAPDYTEQLNHISEQLDTINTTLTAPAEPVTDMNNLEQLNHIIGQLNDLYTIMLWAVVVVGALFVCWLIKKAIDPLLS